MKLKKMKIAKCVAMVLAITAVPVVASTFKSSGTVYTPSSPEKMVYRTTVKEGETLWGVVARVASDKDDLYALVWETRINSHIENVANIKPGTEIVIRPKRISD